MELRHIMSGVAILLASASVFAGEWGHWKADEKPSTNRWVDYSEARADVVPDAWSVKRLAKMDGNEIMLRSADNAMVRWMDTRIVRYLYLVHQNIQRVAEIEAELYITRGDEPNAAAGFRDGVPTVFVNFGMINLINTNLHEWAALLGHEIAHLKLEHGDKQAKRNIPLAILRGAAVGALATDPLASAASGLLVDGIGLKFSRDAEREADYVSVIWAIEAKYNAYGAASLQQRLSEHAASDALPFLSSHPASKERYETLRELADRLTGDQEKEEQEESGVY